ncbi:MAG: hypothetical protein D6802_05790, partial [Ardenticatenia bacterium]
MWRVGKVVLVVLVLMMALARPALANGPIVLDSNMGEWDGHPYIDDPRGDADEENDIRRLYFDTNPNEETLYFMLERWEEDEDDKLHIWVLLD